jgi:hypothetical protein
LIGVRAHDVKKELNGFWLRSTVHIENIPLLAVEGVIEK